MFVTGEVCHTHDRETIFDYFKVPVANGYGSREAGFIAHECPEGGMHITAENVIVEIVDARSQPVSTGESGEIVVTHLDAYAMPFIRYRTGDIGRLKPGRCACGRGLPLIDVVEGRTTDFLYLPDGTVKHALSIIYPLREMDGVRQFGVTQGEDYGVPVEVIIKKFRRMSFEPQGVTQNPEIPMATSILDYVGHFMEQEFTEVGRNESKLKQMNEEVQRVWGEQATAIDRITPTGTPIDPQHFSFANDGKGKIVEANGNGDTCPDCGNGVMFSEGCMKCSSGCGWTKC